jgi:hypothetical protein
LLPHELFALPAGTRIDFWATGQVGTIVETGPAGLVIRWDDGDRMEMEADFEHLSEYAGAMEILAADEPHVIDNRPDVPVK